jgi:hypothetical protein
LEWGFPLNCKADWLAVVDLSRDMVWLLPIEDALEFATGTVDGLTYLAWYPEDTGGRVLGIERDFERYRLDNVIGKIIADAESPETERDS